MNRHAAAAVSHRFSSTARRTIRVLLVEDNHSDAVLIGRMLEDVAISCDYAVSNVPRLTDAFNLLGRQTFDIIMLDLNLGDINGVASVAALRAEAGATPIIVYSGMDDIKLKEEALMCGATHYLVKGRESSYGIKHVIECTLTQQ